MTAFDPLRTLKLLCRETARTNTSGRRVYLVTVSGEEFRYTNLRVKTGWCNSVYEVSGARPFRSNTPDRWP